MEIQRDVRAERRIAERAAARRYLAKTKENPYEQAARLRAATNGRTTYATKNEPVTDRWWRLTCNDLHRRAARTAEDQGADPEGLKDRFDHIDTEAKKARGSGQTPEYFAATYSRNHGLVERGRRRPPTRNPAAPAAQAVVPRGSGRQGPQAQPAYRDDGPASGWDQGASLPPDQPGLPFRGRLPLPVPRQSAPVPAPASGPAPEWSPVPQLPPLRAYLPSTGAPPRPAQAQDPGALPIGAVLPPPDPRAARGPYASQGNPYTSYGLPQTWQPQGPAQGPSGGRARGSRR
ncbi:hypothetical protein GCM10009863_65660 [Streptomyces axinellae]|uniref:Uncharacterized protein n=1 Tax=Streptomyces axinellae TaxID=552788 RepID=A0ABN3QZR6_9ACTN